MQLNDAQNAFISHTGEYIRLLAPAEAGKTASLLYRCVKAVKSDPSRRILIVTFTRVARAVFQERITNAPEFSNLCGRIEVSTLNSLRYKAVKSEHLLCSHNSFPRKIIFAYSVNVHSGGVAPSPYLREIGLVGKGVEGRGRRL
ncbi:UvrD-helicase domain-containing protein [Treponema endosymbiont of Eucomonympha sp.]|uniref:UvrD-helicase domain-containing protein n=1 Tax=Treponema endosymbiont of Eucomonympha sp. TaxID=1580831 RepID=UPI000A60A1CE